MVTVSLKIFCFLLSRPIYIKINFVDMLDFRVPTGIALFIARYKEMGAYLYVLREPSLPNVVQLWVVFW